ncbi:transcriptional regulator BolA [Corallincola platygyrae]|uniref:Transcriptional regulator BolA n=1 Tax=Corallincola platygyrae TaxID=1193278 RepID=A0ABW4XLR5_9GAMM
MSVQNQIENKLLEAFEPLHLEVLNESDNHNVPAGSESHFKVVIVSSRFEGERLLARHRAVNATLAEELAGPVHALAMHTYTAGEWKSNFGDFPSSPQCMGGSKARN